MNKKIKILVLGLMIAITTFSFTKLYQDYQNYLLLNEKEYNTESIRFNFDLVKKIDDNITIDDLLRISKENNLILRSISQSTNDFFYYNPNNIEWFNKKIKNYEKKCDINCYELKELEKSDFNVEFTFSVLSKQEIDKSIFDNTDIIIIENHPEGEEEIIDANREIKMFLDLYSLYFLSFVIIAVVFILMTTITLLKNLKKLQLNSIFGFKFLTIFKENIRKIILVDYFIYVVMVALLLLITVKNIDILKGFILFTILYFGIILILFYIISLILYTNLKKGVNIKFFKNTIYLLSVFIIIFNVLIISLTNNVFQNMKLYQNQLVVREEQKNVYTVLHDENISLDLDINISQYMVDHKIGIYRQVFLESDLTQNDTQDTLNNDSLGEFYLIKVDDNFFEEHQDILKKNGKPFDLKKEYKLKEGQCTFIMTKSNPSKPTNCQKSEYIYLDDSEELVQTYNTFVPPYIPLNKLVIQPSTSGILISNLLFLGESKQEVEKKIRDTLEFFGVDEEVEALQITDQSELIRAKDNLNQGILGLSAALIASMVATSFYAYLLFLKEQNKMILSEIMGYSFLKTIAKSLQELGITTVLILMILIFLKTSIFSFIIFGVILLIQIFVLMFNTKKIIAKALFKFIKGDQL